MTLVRRLSIDGIVKAKSDMETEDSIMSCFSLGLSVMWSNSYFDDAIAGKVNLI